MQFSNGIGHFLFEMKINARKEQTILSYCSDQELLQLVKILLQLLIEPSQEPIIGKQDTLREIIGR